MPTSTEDDGYTWMYLITGSRTHYVNHTDAHVNAVCGTHPGGFWQRHTDWRGTGNQSEYDRAGDLPRCTRCIALITRPDGTLGMPAVKTTP